MSPEQTTRTVGAPAAPTGDPLYTDAALIARRIRVHLTIDGATPEERYFAATGRVLNDA